MFYCLPLFTLARRLSDVKNGWRQLHTLKFKWLVIALNKDWLIVPTVRGPSHGILIWTFRNVCFFGLSWLPSPSIKEKRVIPRRLLKNRLTSHKGKRLFGCRIFFFRFFLFIKSIIWVSPQRYQRNIKKIDLICQLQSGIIHNTRQHASLHNDIFYCCIISA